MQLSDYPSTSSQHLIKIHVTFATTATLNLAVQTYRVCPARLIVVLIDGNTCVAQWFFCGHNTPFDISKYQSYIFSKNCGSSCSFKSVKNDGEF